MADHLIENIEMKFQTRYVGVEWDKRGPYMIDENEKIYLVRPNVALKTRHLHSIFRKKPRRCIHDLRVEGIPANASALTADMVATAYPDTSDHTTRMIEIGLLLADLKDRRAAA